MKKAKYLVMILFAGVLLAGAQSVLDYEAQPTAADDQLYIKHHYKQNRVVPYHHLRESDIMWMKRYWQKIDMKQKLNHNLYYPIVPINDRKSLAEVLIDGVVNEGSVTAYADDEFTRVLTPQEVTAKIFSIDSVQDFDINTGRPFWRVDTVKVESRDVLEYLIKEDWFFDKQRSVMEVRILGICPVAYKENPATGQIEKEQLFWLWFPEARPLLANHEVFNRYNDAERRTFDEIFHKRMFTSYITKESNVYDRLVYDYKRYSSMEQLLEAERIKEQIRNFEHDLWEY
jgi:gliding motility associated protien GldN